MCGDGHNIGHPVLSVTFRFGSICGYVDDEDVCGGSASGGGVHGRPSFLSTQGTVTRREG